MARVRPKRHRKKKMIRLVCEADRHSLQVCMFTVSVDVVFS